MTLIYVSHLKFQKKCATCGNNIPKDAECWWDKEMKLNYHNNCKPSNANPDRVVSEEAGNRITITNPVPAFEYDVEK